MPVTRPVMVDSAALEIEARRQREIVLKNQFANKQRLNNTAYRILKRAVPLCGNKVRYSIGIVALNRHLLPPEMRDAAAALYGISDALQVMHVIKWSASERAGLKEGDIPVSILGWPIPTGKMAGKAFRKKLAEAIGDGYPIDIKVLRNGVERTYNIYPDRLCAYSVDLNNKDIVNAYADGRRIIVARGMLSFTNNDTELGLVISHELAHNIMNHINAQMRNYMLGSIFDIVAAAYGVDTRGVFGKFGAQAYSKEFEAEADYVGLYIMAMAGLDYENGPEFWRRMAAIKPGSIKTNHMATHPATPFRFLALEKTVKEIKSKIASGMPLEPEMKR